MLHTRLTRSLRMIVAAGLVVAVGILAWNAPGWVGTASAQTVPTAPPPTNTPVPPAPTKTPIPAATYTSTATPLPTETAVPTETPPPTETETPISPPPTAVPSPTPVPAPSPLPVSPWCIGGIALAILALLLAAWLVARRRPKG